MKMRYQEINDRALASDILFSLYPQGKRHGRNLRAGTISGDSGSSFCVCLHTGRWKDYATGESGRDLVSLYAARQGISQSEAARQLSKMVGADIFLSSPSLPESRKKKNSAQASTLWQESFPLVGTQTELYLKGRNISIVPDSLRHHPGAYHGVAQHRFPCMLAGITRWPEKSVHAVHRTFLESGKKAHIKPNKMMLGSVAGGAVRLAPVNLVMAIAEGIETALSVQQETGIPTWAVLSASNYKALVLPGHVQEIVIAADHDEVGIRTAYEAAELWTRQGRKVRVTFPPRPGSDFNDIINSAGILGHE